MPTPDELPFKPSAEAGDQVLLQRDGALYRTPFNAFRGPGIPTGGVTGQFLRKASGIDFDGEWATVPLLTNGLKGDINVTGTSDVWTIVDTTISPFGRTVTSATSAIAMRSALGLGSAAVSATTDFAAAVHTHVASDITNFNTAADARITLQKGAVNGLATLDAGGKIPSSQLPPIALNDTFVVASEPAMLALTAEIGDIAVRTDVNRSFVLRASPPSVLANWQELLTPTDTVLSVNGFTGTVSLSTTNISEGTNLYFTDERAQDAVGTILTDSTTIDFTYNDVGNTITAAVLPGGVDKNLLGGAALTLLNGGTGATTAAAARVNLGLGSAALSATTDFLAASTTLDSISGTLSVTKGGTGATSAVNARTNLGLSIGTDVQAQNSRLQDIATNLTATSGTVEKTGANTFGVYTVTTFGKSLIDDADATAARTTLGLATPSTFAEATIADIAAGTASRAVTATNVNQFLGYGTSLVQGAAQSISTGGSGVILTFGTGSTQWDDPNWHSETVNTSRITVDFTGRVRLNAGAGLSTTAAGLFIILIYRNGAEIGRLNQAVNGSSVGPSLIYERNFACTSGDFFEVGVFQNTGASVNTIAGSTYFQVTRIR